MKTRELKIEDGGSRVAELECGGTSPLSSTRHVASNQSADTSAHSKTWRRWLVCLCFLLSAYSFRASGQSYSIDWFKISGGGGTSTNGQYAVTGTIGQPDATLQPMTGGNYSLTGGFWALISVVQSAGAPTLYISHSGSTVTVYWQNVSGWTLHQNGDLSNPDGWSASGGVGPPSNGTNTVTITPPAGNLFFQLQHP